MSKEIEDIEATPENMKILSELFVVYREKKSIIKSQKYEEAAKLRDKEINLIRELGVYGKNECGNSRTGRDFEEVYRKLLRLTKIKSLLDE